MTVLAGLHLFKRKEFCYKTKSSQGLLTLSPLAPCCDIMQKKLSALWIVQTKTGVKQVNSKEQWEQTTNLKTSSSLQTKQTETK